MKTNETASAVDGEVAAAEAKAPSAKRTKAAPRKSKPAPKRAAAKVAKASSKKGPLTEAQVKKAVKKGMAQAKAEGAKARGESKGPKPRLGSLEVGTLLKRTFKGKEIVVKVTDAGFLFEGKTYGSISGLAGAITGYMISGPVFFGLVEPKAAAKKA